MHAASSIINFITVKRDPCAVFQPYYSSTVLSYSMLIAITRILLML